MANVISKDYEIIGYLEDIIEHIKHNLIASIETDTLNYMLFEALDYALKLKYMGKSEILFKVHFCDENGDSNFIELCEKEQ